MRIIVDSNMLEAEELREFLTASPVNRVVLVDYIWIEAYRYDAVNSIVSRLSILKDFPDQVELSEGTRTIAELGRETPDIVSKMVRPSSRSEFGATVMALKQIRAGVPGVIEQVLEHARTAEQLSKEMAVGAPEILTSLPEMQEQTFTAAEVRLCRTSKSFSPQMLATIFGAAEQIGEFWYERDAECSSLPPADSRWNFFPYRCALAIVIYLILWIQKGSPKVANYNNVHNDMVDLVLAVLSTYFNGLMSKDKRALSLYWNLRGALVAQGANVPPDWTEAWAS